MTDLIGRQKIYKRKTQAAGADSGASLINAAARFRYADHNKGRKNVFKKFRIRLPKRGKESVTSDQHVKRRKSENPGPSGSGRGFGSGFKKKIASFFSALKSKTAAVNPIVLFSIAGAAAAVVAVVYFTDIYIENKTMFEEFALHSDLKIEDVLYESLPSDYNGQGSGELVGVEPVLLTAGEPISYTVKSGDTLSEISKNNNIKIGTLISFNKISDVRRLQVGMELKIPEYDGVPYEVKAGDSLSAISKKHNISVNAILDANDLDSAVLQPGDILFIPGAAMNEFDYKKAMGTLFIYPTRGRLSSGFGYRPDPFTGQRRFHNGLDLANAMGTRISATMAGIVADVGDRPSGYGKYVIIKHPNGYQSLYGHMSKIIVREGQYVSQGEKLGEMGSTGRSTGPHLHFSIYKNNTPVNPKNYLW